MIVVDANVMLAAFRSTRGASHWLLRALLNGEIPFAVSTAVVIEYEDVLKRPGLLGESPWVSAEEIDVVLDALISRANLVFPTFRFRPLLDDPKDDLYLECAIISGARLIVSSDKHFNHPIVNALGIEVKRAGDFVGEIVEKRRRS